MSEKVNGYPVLQCDACDIPMDMIGIGTASGRLCYQCPKCNAEKKGKNPAAMALGALGGKARAEALTAEERQRISEKGNEVLMERRREKLRNSNS